MSDPVQMINATHQKYLADKAMKAQELQRKTQENRNKYPEVAEFVDYFRNEGVEVRVTSIEVHEPRLTDYNLNDMTGHKQFERKQADYECYWGCK